jgi:hypothetical protein
MKTIQLWCTAGAALLLAGCGGSDNQENHSPASSSLSTSLDGIPALITVTFRSDTNGGYFLDEIDGARQTVHVDSLDLNGLAAGVVQQLKGAADSELVLRGVFENPSRTSDPGPFAAMTAWRGLPGVVPPSSEGLLQISTTGGKHWAQRLSGGGSGSFDTMSFSGIPGLVNESWLKATAFASSALVAGKINGTTVDATQVYLELPAGISACSTIIDLCTKGETPTFEQESDLCIAPTGCATKGACSGEIPDVPPGYSLVSWTKQPDGCMAYAANPSFLTL